QGGQPPASTVLRERLPGLRVLGRRPAARRGPARAAPLPPGDGGAALREGGAARAGEPGGAGCGRRGTLRHGRPERVVLAARPPRPPVSAEPVRPLPSRSPARVDRAARPRRPRVPCGAPARPADEAGAGLDRLPQGPFGRWDWRTEKMSRKAYASVRLRCDGSASDEGER